MKNGIKGCDPSWQRGLDAANAAPRCGAKKRRKGTPCGSTAMAKRRCRIHGGLSTGPKTEKGIEQIRQAQRKHGQRSAEAIKKRKQGMELRREIRLLNKLINEVERS
jgi:hypothetical protein